MKKYRILVAGAGIGGLTAASCLAKAGHDVEIYEQAPQLAEIGAGIQISANAMHVLRDLGLEGAIVSVGVSPGAYFQGASSLLRIEDLYVSCFKAALFGFISAVIAMRLPGAGSIYLSQSLRFTKPVRIGDTVTARVEVLEVLAAKRRVRLATACRNQNGETVVEGEAVVMVDG